MRTVRWENECKFDFVAVLSNETNFGGSKSGEGAAEFSFFNKLFVFFSKNVLEGAYPMRIDIFLGSYAAGSTHRWTQLMSRLNGFRKRQALIHGKGGTEASDLSREKNFN